MPLDLAFSSWFFYLFRQMLLVLGDVIGPSGLGRLLGRSVASKFPYLTEQSVGAFLMLFGAAIYLSRRHLREIVMRRAKDVEEPMSYPFAIAGLVGGCLFLIVFCRAAGMDIWVVILLFALYFAISLVITRMRAELGPPTHELTNMSSAQILVDVFGSARLKVNNLVVRVY